MRMTRRKWIAAAASLVPAWFLGRPAVHLARTAIADGPGLPAVPVGKMDDASRMNESDVDRIVLVRGPRAEAERTIADALADARARKLAVSVAGARHAMGGHAIAKGGVVLDMTGVDHAVLDEAANRLTCGAGARWHDLIDVLDPKRRAIAVMQSNDSFSVGGSLSVNCHGWQPNRPPIASTVQALRVVRADGTAVDLRRGDELFSLVLGGYGLFGVIVEATLDVVPNVGYVASQFGTTPAEYVATFRERATGADVGMAFGRLSVDPDAFLEDAILTVYRDDPTATALPPVGERDSSRIARLLFRGEVESSYGKHLRWSVERHLGNEGGSKATRNQLLREPVTLFQNRRPEMTDILHEYFVPADRFASFVDRLKRTLPASGADLLNVTVRNVSADTDTFLAYATTDVFSFVMLFSQRRTPEGETAMTKVTRDLVDAALAEGGRYYLPYRLHPTKEQLLRAYPRFAEFTERKRALDPNLVFQNELWRTYA